MFRLSKEKPFSVEASVNLFQQFLSTYLQAEKKAGHATEVHFRVAGINVCLKFAGKHLASAYVRAISHLITGSVSNPDLIIYVWDTKTTNQPLPKFLDEFNRFVDSKPNAELRAIRGDVPILTNNVIRTALLGTPELTMANLERKICVHWVPDATEIPYYDRAAPLRVSFNFMFGSASRQLLHGGAVGTKSGGVFLGGIGGSGKSTAALNCISSALSYASDDYVLVHLENLTAYSLYSTAKVKTLEDLKRFPQFLSWIDNQDGVKFNEEKPLLFLNDRIPEKLISEIPLKAIVFPRFAAGQEEIRYQPMSQQRAFREIATSTIRQTPNDNQPAISMIGNFIKKLPCYELFFGEAQENLPEYITEIINLHS